VMVLAASSLEIGLPLAVPLLAGVVAWWANSVRAERTRLQKLYADAFSAVVSYQEFPYVIRRRRAPLPGQENIPNEERLRISQALQVVQEALANYRAQISTESSMISARYDALVSRTRTIAGKAMHEAWQVPPLDNDAGMNITHIDYSKLADPERQYLDAVKKDVTFTMIATAGLRSVVSWGKSP
jgi:hypothetical protein